MASVRWRYPRGLIDPPAAVELVGGPLQLLDRGWWVPGDEYWGEVDGAVPVPLVEVAAGGARRSFEFEQLLPGGDDPEGVCVAERSLPEDFDEVLGWGWVDNRPFLRCLHGLTLSAWRLELYEEAEELCWALLWLNPGDHLGAAELVAKIVARQSWSGRR